MLSRTSVLILTWNSPRSLNLSWKTMGSSRDSASPNTIAAPQCFPQCAFWWKVILMQCSCVPMAASREFSDHPFCISLNQKADWLPAGDCHWSRSTISLCRRCQTWLAETRAFSCLGCLGNPHCCCPPHCPAPHSWWPDKSLQVCDRYGSPRRRSVCSL